MQILRLKSQKKKKKAVRLRKKFRFYPIYSGKTKEDLSSRVTGSDSFKTGAGKLCSVVLPVVCVNQIYWVTVMHILWPIVCGWFHAFFLQHYSWVVATKIMWLECLNYFLSGPLRKSWPHPVKITLAALWSMGNRQGAGGEAGSLGRFIYRRSGSRCWGPD